MLHASVWISSPSVIGFLESIFFVKFCQHFRVPFSLFLCDRDDGFGSIMEIKEVLSWLDGYQFVMGISVRGKGS